MPAVCRGLQALPFESGFLTTFSIMRTTKDDGERPSYGKRTESYGILTVILALMREDIKLSESILESLFEEVGP